MRLIDADEIGLTDFEILMCNGDYKEALKMLLDKISNQPTAYDIDKVVEELRQKKEEVQRMRNTCVALSDLEVCDIENVTYERAIEIVKQGGAGKEVG